MLIFTFNKLRLILIITTFYFISGCKQSANYNGRYCATVNYFNPNTDTNSDYLLIVSVEDNQLLKLDFPQGFLADGDLPNSTFSNSGKTNFTLSNGSIYSINITGPEAGCFINVAKAIQCMGISKKGIRCRKLTDNTNGLCHHHKIQ